MTYTVSCMGNVLVYGFVFGIHAERNNSCHTPYKVINTSIILQHNTIDLVVLWHLMTAYTICAKKMESVII